MNLAKPTPRPKKPRKRPKRQRKTSLAALKRKLWALFSAYVKDRDGAVCFSCGKAGLTGENWHAGHFFNAEKCSGTRYHPKNVHSQCGRCNLWLRGNGAAYAAAFVQVYGDACLLQLSALSRRPHKWTAPEIEDMIQALQRGGADYEILHADRYEIGSPVVLAQAGAIE